MATPIPRFKYIGKCLGDVGRTLKTKNASLLKNCMKMYKNFGIVFQRKKLKNTSQLCQKDVSK